eukprot:GFKZ01004978.1.p1 GENE.GFKZ01004978.1~~GFKZ01004978.1.p1  ORF type:complete len:168 (-),score=13.20 GFKZ01004978.1:852-1355(-)
MVYRTIFPTFYDPWWPSFRLLDSLDDDLSLFASLFPNESHHRSSRSSSLTRKPSYTYRRSKEGAFLEVELPGVAATDINVSVKSHNLVIKGTRYRRQPGSCAWKEASRKERKHGQSDKVVDINYSLTLRLGDTADLENVEANACGDGLLAVHIPVKEASAREIQLGH